MKPLKKSFAQGEETPKQQKPSSYHILYENTLRVQPRCIVNMPDMIVSVFDNTLVEAMKIEFEFVVGRALSLRG